VSNWCVDKSSSLHLLISGGLQKAKDLLWETCEGDLKGKLGAHQASEGGKYKDAGLEKSDVRGLLHPEGCDNTHSRRDAAGPDAARAPERLGVMWLLHEQGSSSKANSL